jgi:hypothetical protein
MLSPAEKLRRAPGPPLAPARLWPPARLRRAAAPPSQAQRNQGAAEGGAQSEQRTRGPPPSNSQEHDAPKIRVRHPQLGSAPQSLIQAQAAKFAFDSSQ